MSFFQTKVFIEPMKRILSLTFPFVLILACVLAAQTVKRGRNEGTVHIPASNVMGNGNITAYADLGAGLYDDRLEAGTRVGAAIGIAELLQFTVQTSFINFNRLGPTEAHLQATLPGNDRLRFFGFGVRGDLYLSTSLDTISAGADATKPEYNPYPLFSIIADLDFLARPKKTPIKSYLYVSLCDNPRFLFEYNQFAAKTGLELKMYQHSVFCDAGVALYKQKKGIPPAKTSYDQYYFWISPGARYRLKNRFSIMGNLQLTLYPHINAQSSFKPERLQLVVKFEAPIAFRETDAEAIRTIVFMEKRKDEIQASEKTGAISSENAIITKFEKTMADLNKEDETFDYTREENELIRRREAVEGVMEKIEKLLKEDEE
jgi:hypothetical protein